MCELDNYGGASLLLDLPFKGKGARDCIEELTAAQNGARVRLESTKRAMENLVRQFRQQCHHIPIRMVIQNTPRGSYVRWRTSSKNKQKQRYIALHDLFSREVLPLQLTTILASYSEKIIRLNMEASILNHNSVAMQRYLADLELLSQIDKADKDSLDLR